MSITQDGTLDSIARRLEAQGRVQCDRIDSALPILELCTIAKDKVFGVFDSVVTNRWYTGSVDTRAVNGLGEEAGYATKTELSKRAICFVVRVHLATQ
jgi:hypothetical protein